jgi:hypothetical protein
VSFLTHCHSTHNYLYYETPGHILEKKIHTRDCKSKTPVDAALDKLNVSQHVDPPHPVEILQEVVSGSRDVPIAAAELSKVGELLERAVHEQETYLSELPIDAARRSALQFLEQVYM